jgi:CRISPR-associated protein Csx17
MTLHLHHLLGCAPAPLAHYLKALGILRIVAEQKDAEVRGWWQDEHFCLLTKLDAEQLERFLLDDYAPTPFVSPWNKGSGFYSANDPALEPVASSRASRFAPFREGISAGRAPLVALTEADATVRSLKDRTKAKKGMSSPQKAAAQALKNDPEFKRDLASAERSFKALKADLFTPCLLAWRGPHRAWLDAALVWLEEGRPAWPSLLGTGGNDGRLDFTNNAMQRLGELFDLETDAGRANGDASDLLRQCLWSCQSNRLISGAAIGQFYPGGAGGANSSSGPSGDSLVNPWDFVLMLEGAVLFSARATRRLDPEAASRASAPFAVRAHAVGHGTRGREKADRGEQWMPIWTQPTTERALIAMLGEARLQLGRQVAHRPLDVVRAVCRLGVAKGISRFTRFGYLERIGQSKIAVPIGRIEVNSNPRSRLVDDLAPWLDRLQRLARDDHAPARLLLAEGRLVDAVFMALSRDDSPIHWQAILLAAADIESIQAAGTAFKAGPIPELAPEWLVAADDGSVEWRLARCLGSAAGWYDNRHRPHDPIRHHWLPLQPGSRRFLENDRRLAHDTRVVMMGRDAALDLAALVERRLVEALQRGQRSLPLVAASGCEAHPADIAALIAGGVDLERVSQLARALNAVRWGRWQPGWTTQPTSGGLPDEAWIALRLSCLPWPLAKDRPIATDGAMLRRLRAGDGATAVELSLRRLRAVGMRPPLRAAFADPQTARLWAAALAFPISPHWARKLAQRFEPPHQKEAQ